MNATSPPAVHPTQILHILVAHPARWLVPTVAVALVAGAYAMLRPAVWQATQALIVRSEAANSREEPGKFRHSDEMKTVQGTLLELAKSRAVLDSALAEVGPPADRASEAAWPTAEEVDALRGQVKLTPPKGAEFGTTEVFYLKVLDQDRDRAVALARAICDQLQLHSQELRDTKAQSMIDELAKSVALARAALDESTRRLTETETLAGRDLTELRVLQDSNSGESILRRTITEVESELRQVRTVQGVGRELLALLKDAQDDPGQLLATPNRLLESQPALRRLKNGLVDAQLRTALLRGSMASLHPRVVAAEEAEAQIGRHLHDELTVAIRGIQVDLRLADIRASMLQDRLDDATGRLVKLAAVRAAYANQVAENHNRAELLKQAEETLAEAYAAQASAKATSLIAPIDLPEVGTSPVGPGRATILAFGIAGGLLIGMAVLVLTTEIPSLPPAKGPAAENGRASRLPAPLGNVATDNAHLPNGSLSLRQALQKLTDAQTA